MLGEQTLCVALKVKTPAKKERKIKSWILFKSCQMSVHVKLFYYRIQSFSRETVMSCTLSHIKINSLLIGWLI